MNDLLPVEMVYSREDHQAMSDVRYKARKWLNLDIDLLKGEVWSEASALVSYIMDHWAYSTDAACTELGRERGIEIYHNNSWELDRLHPDDFEDDFTLLLYTDACHKWGGVEAAIGELGENDQAFAAMLVFTGWLKIMTES